ncbi:gremlin-1-like [Clavelina lepadiformis]|uniref:gremlin-1-like n=1 Tax=Clavelina lepadiformis TaxID=159417 RepID=UPI0040436F8C
MKLSLLIMISAVALLNLTTTTSAGRNRSRGGRRKSKIPSPQKHANLNAESAQASNAPNPAGENENPATSAKSGQRGRGGRQRNQDILKTGEKAKIVTERRYLKSDWCKSQPVKQHIRTKYCHGVIVNQFCYGQCNSFYIPKDIVVDEREENVIPQYFKSCSFCKPKKEEWISVRLKCKRQRGRGRKRSKHITKKVKRVKGCTCIAVPDLDKFATPTAQQPSPEVISSSGPEINATSIAARYTSNR